MGFFYAGNLRMNGFRELCSYAEIAERGITMVKDKNNIPSYVEEYDILALEDIAEMAKRHVANENHVRLSGRDVPDGTYSDMSCVVWEIFVNAVNFGIAIANNPDDILENHRWKYRV